MKNLSKKILQDIKEKKIKPKARWEFLLKDYFIISLSILAIVVGGLAFSVVIYMIRDNDWDVYENINDSLLEFVLLTLPYFWIVLMAGFIIVSYYNFKHTKKGYRLGFRVFIALTVFSSIFLGVLLYNMGVGRAIDEVFAEKSGFYGKYINKVNQRKDMWMRPERGMLAGVVISMDDEKNFRVSDFDNQVWIVFADGAKLDGFKAVAVNSGVRIIGKEVFRPDVVGVGERGFEAGRVLTLPDNEWLERHPLMKMGKHHFDEMMPPPPKEIIREMIDARGDETSCVSHADCKIPFEYILKSSCSFDSKCINSTCEIVCQRPYDNLEDDLDKSAQCKEAKDCMNCNFYSAEDKKDCICLKGVCTVLVD